MAALTVVDILATYDDNRPDHPTDVPKRGIRGAAGGVYIGPVLSKAAIEGPTTVTHATGTAAGGVEDSTGYRESDTYDASGGTGGHTGSSGGVVDTLTRPTGRTAYIADGVFGGSTPGYPAQRVGQRASAVDYVGALDTGAFIDRRSSNHESVPVGSRRKTTVDVETVTNDLPRPTLDTSTNPSAGTVALIDGADALDADLHADDITGGASGYKGAEILVYLRATDTDEDGTLVGHWSVDGGTDATEISTSALIGAAANPQTVAWYARWRKADANGKIQVGPWSARGTLALA